MIYSILRVQKSDSDIHYICVYEVIMVMVMVMVMCVAVIEYLGYGISNKISIQ